MFDLIGKYFGSLLFSAPANGRDDRRPAAEAARLPATNPVRGRKQPAYCVAAPTLSRAIGCGFLRRRGGGVIAVTSSFERAVTLCDTLNLACGDPPSRRFLDAVHQRRAPL